MALHELVEQLVRQTRAAAAGAFLPELILCGTIVVLLLARMVLPGWRKQAFWIALAGSLAALYAAAPWRLVESTAGARGELFGGMLVYDSFAVFVRSLVIAFLALLTLLVRLTATPADEHAGEFHVLAFGAALGMCLMASANHLLVVFLGVEMASVPSYALAGFLRDRKAASEAALKFAVFGAGTAGVMLYGISLLAGALGSAHLPTMAGQLAETLQTGGRDLVLVLGGLMVLVGVAFKLSAVPFQFWAPDVFEGTSAEVAAYLSVASKAAALALLVRLALGLGLAPEGATLAALAPARHYIAALLTLVAAVTCTFGNLAAYGQSNIKRLLAYSTIAQAGYMMMPVAAAVVLADRNADGARMAIAALAFYAAVYLFMNLASFACVAIIRNRINSEQIDDYAGLIHRSPLAAICLALALLSLLGLPPLAGFAGKFSIFAALLDARLLLLLVIGAFNTVLSLFYYLRVVRVMMSDDAAGAGPLYLGTAESLYLAALAGPIVVVGVWWDGLFGLARAAAAQLMG